MNAYVLVVEDEPELAELVRDNLEHEGFRCELVGDGRHGLERAQSGEHDLLLLDLMLPGLPGLDLLRELRRGRRLPVIVVSARGQEADVIVGLELGADDYVTKPFSMRELSARIRALLRRSDVARADAPEAYTTDTLRFDFRQRQIHARGEVHALSHTENEVLRLLVERRGRAASRAEILDAVWGENAYPSTRTVDNFILRLRAKIEPDPRQPRYLLTVHGVGYQFVGGGDIS